MVERMRQLQQLQEQLLKEQREAFETLQQTQEEAKRAKEEYEKAEADRKQKGETVDIYQANIRKMASEYEEAAKREAEEAAQLAEAHAARAEAIEEQQSQTSPDVGEDRSQRHEDNDELPPTDEQDSNTNTSQRPEQPAESAARHTYDVGYKKWDNLDVDALIAEQDEQETHNTSSSQNSTTTSSTTDEQVVRVLNVVEGDIIRDEEGREIETNVPTFVLERQNNIGQYVLYLQSHPSVHFIADEQPAISVADGNHVTVRFRDSYHSKDSGQHSEVTVKLSQAVSPSKSTATISRDHTTMVIKLKWARHSSEDAMVLTDFGDSRPASIDGGGEVARRAWQMGNVHCRFCGQGLAKPGKITSVFPLPSSNWGEMMDALLCHCHGDQMTVDSDEDGDGGSAASPSSNTSILGALMSLSTELSAKPGTCLVGPTYLLLQRKDLRGSAIRVERNVALAGGYVLQCKRCLTPLGVATVAADPNEDAEARRRRRRCDCITPEVSTIFSTPQLPVPAGGAKGRKLLSSSRTKRPQLTEARLNKFRVVMNDSSASAPKDLFASYSAESHVGAQVLALAETGGCFRFALCGIADAKTHVRMTLVNFTTELQSSEMELRRVMRVEYCNFRPGGEESPSEEETTTWLQKADGRRLFFHEDELAEVLSALETNHALLPGAYNQFQGRKVSFLRW